MNPGRRFFVREPFCGLSHLLGAGLALAGLVLLLVLARGRVVSTVALAIYGVSLVVLYTASGLYHSLWAEERRLGQLQLLDYVAIFLLIAGTYAPLCLITLRGPQGWGLFAGECTLALVGIACCLRWRGFPHWARISLYAVMGWLWLAALAPLRQALPPGAEAWLLGGGAAYCVGAVVFATDRPHLWPGRFSAHDLWHIFVLAGSACHFVLIARFVAPAA